MVFDSVSQLTSPRRGVSRTISVAGLPAGYDGPLMPGDAKTIVRADRVATEQDGMRLDAFVRRVLEDATPAALSNADVRRVIVGGGVLVDGRVVRGAGRPLDAGQRVRVTLRVGSLSSQRGDEGGDRDVRVLFADASLVAVDKPAGLPTVPTADPRRTSLVNLVARSLATGDRPAALGVHQRLDADTSGVVVFSRTPEAARLVDRCFAERRVTKVYLALASAGRLPGDGQLRSRLDTSGRGKHGRVSPAPDGREAETHVTVVERFEGAMFVEASPLTGRKHQVRAHLAAAGCPLLGDTRYGGPASVRGRHVPRPMLHASRLELPHPVTGARIRLESPLAADFADLLAWLRQRR